VLGIPVLSKGTSGSAQDPSIVKAGIPASTGLEFADLDPFPGMDGVGGRCGEENTGFVISIWQ